MEIKHKNYYKEYRYSRFHIGMSPSGKARDFDSRIRRFKSGHPSQKKASRKTCFFLSNPKDWYVITARSAVHVIRRKATVWHHAPACITLRIDAIHHFVMIPYGTLCRFHTATSCGFHTRLRRDWDAEDAHQNREQIRTATR